MEAEPLLMDAGFSIVDRQVRCLWWLSVDGDEEEDDGEEGEEEDSDSEIAREEAAHHASTARCGLGAC